MKKDRILGKTMIFILISVAAILLISIFPFSGWEMAINLSTPLFENWTLLYPPQAAEAALKLPAVLQSIPGNSEVIIGRTLPDASYDDPSLFFITEQQYIRVKINEQLIYEYHPSPKWFGRSPGRAVHLVSIPDNMRQGQVTIAFSSPYKTFSGILTQVWLGSRSSHILNIVQKSLIPLALSYASVLLGAILISVKKRLSSRRMQSIGALYLGLFSIFSGLWIATESDLLLLFFNDPVFMSNLSLISLFILPIPLALYIKRIFHSSRNQNILYLCFLFFLFFMIGTVLQVLNLVDYVQLLPIFHVLATLFILYIIFVGIGEIRSGNKDIRIFFHGCLLFGIAILVDVVLYYLAEIPRASTQGFFRVGMLLFIIFSSLSIGQNVLHMRDIRIKNRVLHSLAYTDALTRLKNRASFEKMIESLVPCLDTHDSITVVVLDINNLKTVNDTLGHTEGDRLLIEGARIMSAALGKLGEIYRIGGDEFAIIIRNTPIPVINEAISDLFERIDSYNEQAASFKISMAYGMDSYQKGKDKDLNSVIIRADKAMYRCKKNQKIIQVVGDESEVAGDESE